LTAARSVNGNGTTTTSKASKVTVRLVVRLRGPLLKRVFDGAREREVVVVWMAEALAVVAMVMRKTTITLPRRSQLRRRRRSRFRLARA